MKPSLDQLDVAVIGTGTMGRGIVQVFASSHNVSRIVWIARTSEGSTRARRAFETLLDQLVSKGKASIAEASLWLSKVAFTDDFSRLENISFVIEAVSENLTEKALVFKALSPFVSASTIIASNTSSLSITQLAACTPYPANVVGLHFFNPAPVMKLAEVIVGMVSSDDAVEWTTEFAGILGKEAVQVKEAPGFIVNRMLIPMINEAIGILAEGVAPAADIDKAMRLGANHPLGPLALADLIGNDVNLSIMETLHQETGDPKYRAHPLLRKMVRANQLGRKTKVGFFQY